MITITGGKPCLPSVVGRSSLKNTLDGELMDKVVREDLERAITLIRTLLDDVNMLDLPMLEIIDLERDIEHIAFILKTLRRIAN